jgi:hypothetical protein
MGVNFWCDRGSRASGCADVQTGNHSGLVSLVEWLEGIDYLTTPFGAGTAYTVPSPATCDAIRYPRYWEGSRGHGSSRSAAASA